MSKPKRHHFVPRAYLERFGQDRRVLIRWRSKPDLIPVGVQNVAVECGFYEMDGLAGERSGGVEPVLVGAVEEGAELLGAPHAHLGRHALGQVGRGGDVAGDVAPAHGVPEGGV